MGPTAVLETAKLLLSAAQCESLPHFITPPDDPNTEEGAEWLLQTQRGEACRQQLYKLGITDAQRKWLARLVSTRRIVVVPMTNALGYDRNQREEGDVDPNRDFPFDVSDPMACMQTIAGRTVNELFQRHLFQMSLTFHAGTEVVGYEWGAFPYLPTNLSPDDAAQVEISSGYSRFAGGFDGTKSYETGTMNELVYAVKGGMEDWAYAGSWDTGKVLQCEPTQYGGYDMQKTVYNESTLRAFNMLIETSNSKIPGNHLGTNQDILNDNTYTNNGHVARNIRLALMAIELVEPYVSIWGVNTVPLKADVVPLIPRTDRLCIQSKAMRIPPGQKATTIAWSVGGGFTVDYTTIMYAKWEDVPDVMDGSYQPRNSEVGRGFRTIEAMSGPTRWKQGWQSDTSTASGWESQGQPMYYATIDTSEFKPGDKIAVFATARLDQGWANQPDGFKPKDMPPMSHVVNARTNLDWRHESAGKIIQGRKDWYSIPLTLVIADSEDDDIVIDLSDRFTMPGMDGSTTPQKTDDGKATNEDSRMPSTLSLIVIVVMVLVSVGLIYIVGTWIRNRRPGRERLNGIDDDDVFVHEFTFNEGVQLRELG